LCLLLLLLLEPLLLAACATAPSCQLLNLLLPLLPQRCTSS
jgi:hypothetical protein